MIEIKLNREELSQGAHLGVDRLVEIWRPGCVAHWDRNIEGALAELAVARALGLDFIPTINTFHEIADIGEEIEVRWTKGRRGSLLIGDNDEETRIFVLVTGRSPSYLLPGWAYGTDIKSQGNFVTEYKEKHQLWGMPQERLRPTEDLIKLLKKHDNNDDRKN